MALERMDMVAKGTSRRTEPLSEFIVVNGELVAFERGTTHLMSAGVRYGLNVFEGLRGYWIEGARVISVFRIADHMERFWQSMRLLRFEPQFTPEQVTNSLTRLIAEGGLRENCHIRVSAYLDGYGDHSATGPVSYFVSALALPRSSATMSGIRCAVSSWTRVADSSIPPRIKTGASYVNVRLARLQAKQDGYDDAILLNLAGKVAEGPGAAIFLVRKGKLITPDITSGVLESITRDTIISLAKERGISVEERPVDRTELYAASEIFFAGTAAEVVPIIDVDGIPVGEGQIGDITAQLQKDYYEVVGGKANRQKDWLTFISVNSLPERSGN
jgi:branched-chain amino acid aminotransferase